MNFIEMILSLFFGKKEVHNEPKPIEQTAEKMIEISSYPMKTNKDMFFHFITVGESEEKQKELWKEAVMHETNGEYEYCITGDKGYYQIKNGQLVGNGSYRK